MLGMTSYRLGMKGFNQLRGTILITPAIKDNELNAKYAKIFVNIIGSVFPKLLLVN
jgi:hypothetical protein